MNLKYYIVITVLLMLLGALGGYFYIYRASNPQLSLKAPNQQNPTLPQEKKDPIFTAKTALVEGVILKAENGEIIVKNTQGIVQNLALGKNLVVYKFAKQNQAATPSSDLQSIQFNIRSIINLNLKNSTYEVVSITQ